MSSIFSWCNNNQGFLSGVLALTTLFVTAYAIFKSSRLQKEIHNRDVQLTFHEKAFEIYSVYCECARLMLFDEYILHIKLGYYSKLLMPIENMLKQREIIRRICDEAALIFDGDEKLIELLRELKNEFLSLSERFIELSQNARDLSDKAIIAVRAAYPDLEPVDMSKILNHTQACELFNSMYTTPEVAQWEKDVNIYVEKISYDNFDTFFKKYLILKQL